MACPAVDVVASESGTADSMKKGGAEDCGQEELVLHEFEREPVPEHALKGWSSFLAIFLGRHTAGTEFSIGPLFIVHGASALDVVLGLFIGNILATMSWRFLCAPVAVRERLTTFRLLELVVGSRATKVYSLFVGILLAMVAGAMFAVSGTAVGVMFDVPMPGLHDWLPTSWAWVAVVAVVGAVTAVVAAFGYSRVSLFSKVITPYMFAVIIYMAVESLRRLDALSLERFWEVANEKIWTGRPEAGFSKYGFFHCVCSAWFCDLILHIGMNDLTILRYAKTANTGWWSAAGMFPGHYFTWIVAGFLYAVQLDNDPTATSVAPGPMANAVAGINGLLCVILAGWSTANPVIYEAGLAVQTVLGRGWSTWAVTLLVGAVGALTGIFPALVMRILDLLAFGGLVIMPMGIILLVECNFKNRFLGRWRSEAMFDLDVVRTNWPAVVTWVVANSVALPLVLTGTVAVFFAPLISGPLSALVYVLGRASMCGREKPELSLKQAASGAAPCGKVEVSSQECSTACSLGGAAAWTEAV